MRREFILSTIAHGWARSAGERLRSALQGVRYHQAERHGVVIYRSTQDLGADPNPGRVLKIAVRTAVFAQVNAAALAQGAQFPCKFP